MCPSASLNKGGMAKFGHLTQYSEPVADVTESSTKKMVLSGLYPLSFQSTGPATSLALGLQTSLSYHFSINVLFFSELLHKPESWAILCLPQSSC